MELGYEFHPGANPDSLGHPQLDFKLYASPTGKHFDPHYVELSIHIPGRGARHEILSYPLASSEYRVCPGKITLLDFVHKEVEAFSFGGRLLAMNLADHAACQMVSSAPIFHILGYSENETMLACEYEAEIARLRARWTQANLDFDDYLADIEPVTLFLALTKDVLQLFNEIPSIHRSDRYWEHLHAIHSAIRFVTPDGKLPPEMPGAKELFESSLESRHHDQINPLP